MPRPNYSWMQPEKCERACNVLLQMNLQMNGLPGKPQQVSLSSWANVTIFEASSHSSSQ